MKILITGGAGFIGSHVAERYLRDGHEVYVLDDLSTGNRGNVSGLEAGFPGKFHMTVDSVLHNDALLELTGTCDRVIHLAAAVGVQYIIDHPLQSIHTNVEGTQNVLTMCDRFRKKVFLASTSEVYGMQNHAPLRETDGCVYGASTKSRWSYAATKLVDEFLGLAYHRTRQLPVVMGRFFNTVGPRQTGRYGMVLPRFVAQALTNEPITVYGDGTQTRTFTHVLDVVEAVVRLMSTPAAEGEVVNIGGTGEISILALAEKIKARTGSRSEIRLVPYDEAYPKDFEDMQRRVPSSEKLSGLTGWQATRTLDDIIRDVVEEEERKKRTR